MERLSTLYWRFKVWKGWEKPTRHFEELRRNYDWHLMVMGQVYPFCIFNSFDKCCYDAVMGDEQAKKTLHALAGGLQ